MIEKFGRNLLYIVYSDDDWKNFNTIELMLELGLKAPTQLPGECINGKTTDTR